MPHSGLVFDGAEDVFDEDLEWCEVGFLFVGLDRVPCGLVYCSDALILILLRENRLWFLFLSFIPSFRRVIGYVLGSILDLYVLLSPIEDVPRPGDFTLRQVFVGERLANC